MVQAGGRRWLRPLTLALALPLVPVLAAALMVVRARIDGPPALGAPPATMPARSGAAMAYDPDRRVVVLFGGQGGPGTVFGDTWTWDGQRWTRWRPPSSPSARAHAAMAWDPQIHRILLVGGWSDGAAGTPADAWSWDGRTWRAEPRWSIAQDSGIPALAWDPVHRRMVLVAPTTQALPPPPPTPPANVPEDVPRVPAPTWTTVLRTWVLDEQSGWQEQPQAAMQGGIGGDPGLAFDPVRRRLVLLERSPEMVCPTVMGETIMAPPMPAGTPASGAQPPLQEPVPLVSMPPIPKPPAGCVFPNATAPGSGGWWWDGGTWHGGAYRGMDQPLDAPPVQDPSTGAITVLQGGVLWSWSAAGWTRHSSPAPFGDRSDAGLVADPALGEVMVVGGYTHGSPAGDDWTWDGHFWVYRSGDLSPQSPLAGAIHAGAVASRCPFDSDPTLRTTIAASGRADLHLDLSNACLRDHLTVQLVDRDTQHPLHVDGNDDAHAVTGHAVDVQWLNWCAGPGEVAAVQVAARDWRVVLTVLTPPPCIDAQKHSWMHVSSTR